MPRRRMQFHVRRPVAIMATEAKMGMCPYCGVTFDAITGVSMSGDTPRIEAGYYSLCASCREVMRYDGKVFCKVTPEEAERVMASSPLWGKVRDAAGFKKSVPKPDRVQ